MSRVVTSRSFGRIYERLCREDAEMARAFDEGTTKTADEAVDRLTEHFMKFFHAEMQRIRD
jgi:hypothetical protein